MTDPTTGGRESAVPAPRRTSAARLRGVTLLALLVPNAALILAWSQDWAHARGEVIGAGQSIAVPGSAAGGAELPLALTGLVLIAALLLAGPVFRAVLGVLQALLGACAAVAAGIAIGDPVSASQHTVSQHTGLTGSGERITASLTAWPFVALVLGLLLVVAGIGLAITVRRWPAPRTSRFDRSRMESASGASGADEPEAPQDPIREWDALSDGDDPTTPSR